MLGRALATALEADWQDTLDTVARARGWPTSRDAARLAGLVRDLSSAYNDPSRALALARDAGPARLGFAFARDVPKGAAAVRELVAAGLLSMAPGAALRVLDVGAGLGASTWGLARALEAGHGAGRVDATWLDPDAEALDLGAEILRARAGRGRVDLRVRALRRAVEPLGDLGVFDVVILGQLLSELDVGLSADLRCARHAALTQSLLDRHTAEGGALVLIEPALRERTRHLHRVRDACASAGATIFAPCLHAGACPTLAQPGDWCHEDLPVDLPPWLAPVARGAGLRWEGLTFSYLVLRKDGQSLADRIGGPVGAARLRVVSDLIRSKGKREAFACGTFGGVVGRARTVRLDRSADPRNAAWERLRRGDILVVDPAPELERPRVLPHTTVRSIEGIGETEIALTRSLHVD